MSKGTAIEPPPDNFPPNAFPEDGTQRLTLVTCEKTQTFPCEIEENDDDAYDYDHLFAPMGQIPAPNPLTDIRLTQLSTDITFIMTHILNGIYDIQEDDTTDIRPTIAKHNESEIDAVMRKILQSPLPPTTVFSLMKQSCPPASITVRPNYDCKFDRHYDDEDFQYDDDDEFHLRLDDEEEVEPLDEEKDDPSLPDTRRPTVTWANIEIHYSQFKDDDKEENDDDTLTNGLPRRLTVTWAKSQTTY